MGGWPVGRRGEREQSGRGGRVGRDLFLQANFETGRGGVLAIGEAGMVAGDEVGEQRTEEFQFTRGVLGAGGGVVDLGGNFRAFFEVGLAAAGGAEIRLKLGGVFSEVVPEAGEARPVGGVEGGGKGGRELRHGLEVAGVGGVGVGQ